MYEKFEKFGLNSYPPEIRGRFNSFITTQFDDSLSVEMQLRSIIKWAKDNFDETVSQTNHLIDFINDLIEYMNEFIDTFDDRYQETILDKMQEWYDNGELETLINESLDTKYHEMDDRLTTQDEQLITQLTEHEKKLNDNPVKPEDFNGTDYEKLQQAFDEAITQKRPLQISKTYDIGNNTITLNKESEARYHTFIEGGGTIKKSESGYIFNTVNISVSDFAFDSITFEGVVGKEVKVFDNGEGKLVRLNTSNCYFKNVHTVFYTTDYVQSIRADKNVYINIINSVFDVGGAYDVVCTGDLFEATATGVYFADKSTGSHPSMFNVRIDNCCIEGSNSDRPVLSFKVCETLTISQCYFEKNKGGNIFFQNDASLRNVTIKNCSLFGSYDDIPLISWAGACFNATGEGNYSFSNIVNDFTRVDNRGYRIHIKNHFYYNSEFNKDINANPSIVYYESTTNALQIEKQSRNAISPEVFKGFLTASDSGDLTKYKDDYISVWNENIIMGGLSLAVRGSDYNNETPVNLIDKSGTNKVGIRTGFLNTELSGSDNAGAIVFSDEVDNYFSFPVVDYDEMTLEYVFTPLRLPVVGNSSLLGCSDYRKSGYFLAMGTNGSLYFALNNNTAQSITSTNRLLNAGQKYVVQVRYSSIDKSVDITINGVTDTYKKSSLHYKNLATRNLLVGRDSGWQNIINHKMYKLNVYNRCLTDEEILVNYNAMKG